MANIRNDEMALVPVKQAYGVTDLAISAQIENRLVIQALERLIRHMAAAVECARQLREHGLSLHQLVQSITEFVAGIAPQKQTAPETDIPEAA